MPDPELIEFIKEHKARFSREDLRESLIHQGQEAEEVDAALDAAYPPSGGTDDSAPIFLRLIILAFQAPFYFFLTGLILFSLLVIVHLLRHLPDSPIGYSIGIAVLAASGFIAGQSVFDRVLEAWKLRLDSVSWARIAFGTLRLLGLSIVYAIVYAFVVTLSDAPAGRLGISMGNFGILVGREER